MRIQLVTRRKLRISVRRPCDLKDIPFNCTTHALLRTIFIRRQRAQQLVHLARAMFLLEDDHDSNLQRAIARKRIPWPIVFIFLNWRYQCFKIHIWVWIRIYVQILRYLINYDNIVAYGWSSPIDAGLALSLESSKKLTFPSDFCEEKMFRVLG